MQHILINSTFFETRVAVLESGSLQELHIERTAEAGWVGNIYLGKVTRVLPGMQSAFIDIGLEKAGFLHIADLISPESKPIQAQIFVGQSLVVQVIKDPLGSKGPRLTTQISLAGRVLVYLPYDHGIGISQKISRSQAQAQLLSRFEKCLELVQPQSRGGYILRTNAEQATDEELQADICYLHQVWQDVNDRTFVQAPATLLRQELRLAQRVLRDMATEDTTQVSVDNPSVYQQLSDFVRSYIPSLESKLHLYQGSELLFKQFEIEKEIALALQRRVDLPNGTYLIFDQTEALTTIDINTGRFVGGTQFEQTIYQANLQAIGELVRQVRLRNLGGIIIIDFIDMQQESHRQSILSELSQAMLRDRMYSSIGGFTSLGLVEMTRKRTRESLQRMLCQPCQVCAGAGRIRSTKTICFDLLRDLNDRLTLHPQGRWRIWAHSAVVEELIGELKKPYEQVCSLTAAPVELMIKNDSALDEFEIIHSN